MNGDVQKYWTGGAPIHWVRDVAEKDHDASAPGPQKQMQLTFDRTNTNTIAGRMASTRVDEQES